MSKLASIVIFRGRRYTLASVGRDTVSIAPLAPRDGITTPLVVVCDDRDLILLPTCEDLEIAEAFERGEISVFEYADGRTYPPQREIRRNGALTPANRVH